MCITQICLLPSSLATTDAVSRSVSRRIETIRSSVNLDLFVLPLCVSDIGSSIFRMSAFNEVPEMRQCELHTSQMKALLKEFRINHLRQWPTLYSGSVVTRKRFLG